MAVAYIAWNLPRAGFVRKDTRRIQFRVNIGKRCSPFLVVYSGHGQSEPSSVGRSEVANSASMHLGSDQAGMLEAAEVVIAAAAVAAVVVGVVVLVVVAAAVVVVVVWVVVVVVVVS